MHSVGPNKFSHKRKNKFGPIWTILDMFGQVQTILDKTPYHSDEWVRCTVDISGWHGPRVSPILYRCGGNPYKKDEGNFSELETGPMYIRPYKVDILWLPKWTALRLIFLRLWTLPGLLDFGYLKIYRKNHWKKANIQVKHEFLWTPWITVWPEPIWIKVSGWWQIQPQHQSTYLTGQ